MTGADPADPTFRSRSRELLSDTLQLSLDALRREGGADGEPWLAGFPRSAKPRRPALEESLGAAICGPFCRYIRGHGLAAAQLSLLDRVLRGAGERVSPSPAIGRSR